MDSTASTSEPLINVITWKRAKDADRLGPKRDVARHKGLFTPLSQAIAATGEQAEPTLSMACMRNVVSP